MMLPRELRALTCQCQGVVDGSVERNEGAELVEQAPQSHIEIEIDKVEYLFGEFDVFVPSAAGRGTRYGRR